MESPHVPRKATKSLNVPGSPSPSDHKIVKKAKSFREDFKGLIKRRSSNNPMSPHHAKKERIGRNLANHVVDGAISPGRRLLDDNKKRLQTTSEKVHRSLRFINEVVEKQKFQILPGSASIVLENIIEVFGLINNMLSQTDSTMLTSRHSQVYQSLAQFIRWTDEMSLTKYQTFDKTTAKDVIATLSESLDQLIQFAVEKLEAQQKSSGQLSPIPAGPPYPEGSPSKRYSYPEIPLTPRDKDTTVTPPLSTTTQTKSRSTDNLFTFARSEGEVPADKSPACDVVDGPLQVSDDRPPPKPPLPPNHRSIGKVPKSASFDGVLNDEEELPPPIPDKSRSSNPTPHLTPIKINHFTQSTSSHTSQIMTKHLSHESFTSVMTGRRSMMSSVTGDTGLRSRFSSGTGTPGSPFSDPFDSPLRSNYATMFSRSPISSSPMNYSPCSSLSSGLNTSHDDIDGSFVNRVCIQNIRKSPESDITNPFSDVKTRQGDGKVWQTDFRTLMTDAKCLRCDLPPQYMNKILQADERTRTLDGKIPSIDGKFGQTVEGNSQVIIPPTTDKKLPPTTDGNLPVSQPTATNGISPALNTNPPIIDGKSPILAPSFHTAMDGISPALNTNPPIIDGKNPILAPSFPKHCTCDPILSPTLRLNQLMTRMNNLSIQLEKQQQKPLLPDKQRPRLLSTYDNIPFEAYQQLTTAANGTIMSQVSCESSMMQRHETFSSTETFSSGSHSSIESLRNPPPLPPKTRHIQEYMKTIGSYTQPTPHDYISRHSLNFYGLRWQQHHFEMLHPRSNTMSMMSDLSSTGSDVLSTSSGSLEGPWKPLKDSASESSGSSTSVLKELAITHEPREKASSLIETPVSIEYTNDGTLKRSSAPITLDDTHPVSSSPVPHIQKDGDSDFAEINVLEDVDVSDQLIMSDKKKKDEHAIRGGQIDALIVHATTAGKNDVRRVCGGGEMDTSDPSDEDFLYQEAFLTTYRTFISSKLLLTKLLHRFNKFHQGSENKKHLARNTFSLIIRVVDELAPPELTNEMASQVMGLEFELVAEGTLVLARVLRNKLIEKMEQRNLLTSAAKDAPLASLQLSMNIADVMQFKAHEIAEQMTLLDAKLFQTIEIPEVLLWAKEQSEELSPNLTSICPSCYLSTFAFIIPEVLLWAKEQSEELSPNLTKFTIHFNNMSYWCRTKILMQEDARDREKYLVKFIKILRHLRKFNNFNSYLAVLSAVDSAPIRRLDFSKSNLENLKELSQLIDSSSSFRAYRLAVADTEPPCIPYIGLILQDLTFIHIGNADNFQCSSVNFAKRWQQFHILDNMRRFKKCNYEFKRNERLQQAFGNFEDYHSEEVLWQISEKIKPRATPKKKGDRKT